MGLVTGPAQNGGIACIGCDTSIIAITSADRFSDDAFGLGEQKFDPGGIVCVLALDSGEVIEVISEAGFEVIGLGHHPEDGIKQPAEDDHADDDTSRNIGKSTQGLEQIAHPKGCDETPENPRLIVELEDGVDAIPELVTQIDKLWGKDKERAQGEEEKNKG